MEKSTGTSAATTEKPRKSLVGFIVRVSQTVGHTLASMIFEELDYQETPMGELTLRRRTFNGADVFEVKLGDEYLMSSLFVVAEEELAHLGLAAHANPRRVLV